MEKLEEVLGRVVVADHGGTSLEAAVRSVLDEVMGAARLVQAQRLAEDRHRTAAGATTEVVGFTEVIASHVRGHRQAAGWTQERLAEAMSRLGFGWKRLTVVEVEGTARKASLEEVLGLSILFGVPVVQFLLPADTQDIALPNGHALDSGTVAELVAGGPLATPDPATWKAARRAALVGVDDDWRPAPDLAAGRKKEATRRTSNNTRLQMREEEH